MRQTLQTKTFVTMAGLVVAALVFSFFKASSVVQKDKETFLKEESAQGALLISELVQTKLGAFRAALRQIPANGSDARTQEAFFQREPDVALAAVFSTSDKSKPPQVIRNTRDEFQRWNKDFDSWLNRVRVPDLKSGDVSVERVSFVEGYVFFGIFEKRDDKVSLILLPSSGLASIVFPFKGSPTSVFLVNNQGIAVAHASTEYVGAQLTEHPVVAELTRSISTEAAGSYEDLEGRRIYALYRRIPQTNLTLVVSRLYQPSFAVLGALRGSYLQILFGFIFFALAAAVYFSHRIRKGLGQLKSFSDNTNPLLETAQIQDPELLEVAEDLARARADLAEREKQIQNEYENRLRESRSEVLIRMSRGVAEQLRNPMAGILGHTQILREKSADREDLKKHLDAIEKETRHSREFVEELGRHAGFSNDRFEATDVYDVMILALERIEHRFALLGIKIQRQLESTPVVRADASHLLHALVQILNFSAHLLEGSPVKSLVVRLVQEGRLARIEIEHTGVSLTDEQQAELFTPFRFSKASSQDFGLGLSAAEGVIRSHMGRIYYVQAGERGGRFVLEIPVTEARADRKKEELVIPTRFSDVDFEEIVAPVPTSAAARPVFDIPMPPAFARKDGVEVQVKPPRVENEFS